MKNLTLRQKIGQMMMIGFQGTTLPGKTATFIKENNIGSVILFSRNIESIEQVRQLTDHLHNSTGAQSTPLIFTDQEGGYVMRFSEMAATVVSPMAIAAADSPEHAEVAGQLIAEDMRICGIDGVFAPVLDVNTEEENPVIGIRSYSDLPDSVIGFAKRFARGLNAGGVLTCGKHYPGHGTASADSHLEIPSIPVSYEYFMHTCYRPFEVMTRLGIDSLMTAHVKYPFLADQIATFSPMMVRDLLRKRAKYDGVVFSDCLEMKAVKDNFTVDQIARNVLNAGLDILIVSHTPEFQKELLEAILANVENGNISEERIDSSLERIRAMKEKARILQSREANLPPTPPTRKNIRIEQSIADDAVTLLRNRFEVLPVEKDRRILVLEWTQQTTAPSVIDKPNKFHNNEKNIQTPVERISKQFLPNRYYRALNPAEPFPEGLLTRLSEFDYIIALIYGKSGDVAITQTNALIALMENRKDSIVVSLDSPYEIKKFPQVDTYLVTYGYSDIQLNALFKVLTAQIPPAGKLPIEIKHIFPRGTGLNRL
jgi:beta-N-acetylhexosaminidase